MIALIDVKGNDDRKIDKNSSVNIRNMQELSLILNADFFYNALQLKLSKITQYDIIIFGFGSVSSNINEVVSFIKKQKNIKNVFWLIGEYEQSMNPSLYYSCKELSKKYTAIKNFYKNEIGGMREKEHIININLLIARTPNAIMKKKYDCIYYSRWRDGRAKYLREYLQGDIYFSSDTKNFKQHKHIGCNPKYIKKLSWSKGIETLNQFRYSLYLEDEHTHKVYNHLANRFYEALFCNVVQFFDINCKNTIIKSGIPFDNYYYVKNKLELDEKIKEVNESGKWAELLKSQSIWNDIAIMERTEMIKKLKGIFEI